MQVASKNFVNLVEKYPLCMESLLCTERQTDRKKERKKERKTNRQTTNRKQSAKKFALGKLKPPKCYQYM